jgi:hypothetical protein
VASAVVVGVVECKIVRNGVGLAESAVGATQKLKGTSGEWIAHIAEDNKHTARANRAEGVRKVLY